MAKTRIRKGDTVVVLTGRDKGRRGSVLRVLPEAGRALVQGVHLVKRHTAPSRTSGGGILEKEATIDLSNLALIDPKTDKPTRVGVKIAEGDRKVRYAKRSGEVLG